MELSTPVRLGKPRTVRTVQDNPGYREREGLEKANSLGVFLG
jgi:hypothetical protein